MADRGRLTDSVLLAQGHYCACRKMNLVVEKIDPQEGEGVRSETVEAVVEVASGLARESSSEGVAVTRGEYLNC